MVYKELTMKYYLLSNSCVINLGDKTYTISNDDYRYDKIKENLINKNFDLVSQLVDPTLNINKEGFVVKDGLVFYNNNPMPSVLGNKFLELHQNSWEFKSIFNFWFNLRNKIDKNDASEVIQELINKNAYAATEDGFYFLYFDKNVDQTSSNLNKKRGNVFHFYNYANCPNVYFSCFDNKQSMDQVIESTFGFNSKKLKNLVLQNVFKQEQNFINYKFFFFGETFKDVLHRDNLFYVIENDLLDTDCGDIDGYRNLATFFKDYSIDKNGEYSQKKIINFLQSATNKRHIVDVGIFYVQLKDKLNLDVQNLEFSNNCELFYEYLFKEIQKIKDPMFNLDNDLEIQVLHDVEFSNFRILVPNTNYDLKEWTNILQNCVGNGSYAQKILKKQSQIIAIVDKDKNEMLYNIEISRKNIIQFLARGNNPPKNGDKVAITEFLQSKNLIFKE